MHKKPVISKGKAIQPVVLIKINANKYAQLNIINLKIALQNSSYFIICVLITLAINRPQ